VTIGWIVILLFAGLLRFGPIFSGLPYSDYIDEGFVLHQTINVLKSRSFDTRWYGYPSLPAYLTAASMLVASPIYRHGHGHSFRRDLPPEETGQPFAYNYDRIGPTELIISGRLVTATLSLATVVLTGLLAARLAGNAAALTALILSGLCPALVLRGSNVIVDTFATFFVVLALLLSALMRSSGKIGLAVGAGLSAGAAFACKYTAGAVSIAILAAVVVFPSTKTLRVKLILAAVFGLFVGTALGLPAVFLNWPGVVNDLAFTRRHYGSIVSSPGYFGQAVLPDELGWLLVVSGCVGIVVMFREEPMRRVILTWSLFALVLFAALLPRPFQPFRNLLPLVPIFCVAAGIALATAIARVPQTQRWLQIGVAAAFIGATSLTMGFESVRFLHRRMTHRDSRIQAIDWLREHTTKEQRVLAITELGVLPEEWRKIPAVASTMSFIEASARLENGHFDYVVIGDLDPRFAANSEALSRQIDQWREKTATLTIEAEFGSGPTFVVPFVWRTTDERIKILRTR
jgi:hypothetical protein